jgi:hypothetical protein
MGKDLKDVLATPANLSPESLQRGTAQQSIFVGDDTQVWGIVARLLTSVDDMELYEARDGNQFAFLSTVPPKSPRGGADAKQVTWYKTGTVLFRNMEPISPAELTDAEVAAGRIYANHYGFIELSDAELKAAQKIVDAVPATE